MGRDAIKASENPCFRCRKEAARYNDKLNSREGAAEMLGVSVSSLADYELGITKVIPVDKVVLMAELYNAPELKTWYCASECPIGRSYPIPTEPLTSVERTTMRLLKSLKQTSVDEVRETLIDITADGVISDDERVDLAEILQYSDGKLSICGVVGPMSNGNCHGSAGQCVDSIREGEPKAPWTREMLDKFCSLWDRWHLNDMKAACEHQRELGWESEAKEEITLYHYRLTREASDAKREAEKAAVSALRNGETFTPTKEQQFFANLPYGLDIYEAPAEELAPYYEPKKPLYSGDTGPTERKTRGWVRYDESELGILCKPCPVCGYKYGTSWKKEDVPQEVIDWLFSLPDTEVTPAWV